MKLSNKTFKRSFHLDLLRILACIMVILTHAPMPHEGWYGPLLSGLSYFCAPCIGLFFMVSGALLLTRQYQDGFDTSFFLKKRLLKILVPTLIWSVIGAILSCCGIKNSENGVLWFMFALTGLYLLTPIIYRWLNVAKKQEVEFYLFLWGISLCYPLLKVFIKLNESPSSWIYYFHGYAGYFILGYYLAKYEINRITTIGFIFAFAVFSIAFPFFSLLFDFKVNFYTCFWYLSISVALQCVLWWSIFKKISGSLEFGRPIIEFISKQTFGIYLIHVLVLRNILWKLNWIQSLSGIIQILTCVFLTFVISLFLSWIISKLRFGKYIVGT